MTAAPAIALPVPGREFDFLEGTWRVKHRQLVGRNIGSTEWREYEGDCWCKPLLDNHANIEEHHFTGRGGDKGIALRLFEPATGEWMIYWVSGQDGLLCPPVRGRFEGFGCVLEGADTDNGQPIVARYMWSRTDQRVPHWEQAFSYDGGKTWELNWVMDFHPAAAR